MSYLIEVKKIEHSEPIYRKAKIKPLEFCLKDINESVDSLSRIDEQLFFNREVKNQLGKVKDVYVDEESWKLLNELMILSNLYAETIKSKLNEKFEEELFYRRVDRNKIIDEIKNLPWYKRLLNKF